MTLSRLSKAAVVDAFIDDLTSAITEATARAKATAASATHAEARREDDKDTRGLEESYLAAGQAQRVADLELERAALRAMPELAFDEDTPLTAGALVLLQDEQGAQRLLLITTASGGRKVVLDQQPISAVTPAAPMGRALMGKVVGDEVVIVVKKRRQILEIVDVL